MEYLFYGMNLIVKHGTKDPVIGSLYAWNAASRRVCVSLRGAGKHWYPAHSCTHKYEGPFDPPPLEFDPAKSDDPSELVPFRIREIKGESLHDFLEIRRRRMDPYPVDMLDKWGRPNWDSGTFFDYKVRSVEGFIIRTLMEEWVTYDELLDSVAKKCKAAKLSPRPSRVKKVLTAMIRKEYSWLPPGLGYLVAKGGKLHLVYDRAEAIIEHEKFITIRHPHFKLAVAEGYTGSPRKISEPVEEAPDTGRRLRRKRRRKQVS